jgi:hypothetical protein
MPKNALMTRILAVANSARLASDARGKPTFKWDFEAINAEESKWCAEIEAINKAAGKGLAVGRCLTFGVADGTANYIVTKVRKNDVVVEWIPMGDDYWSSAVGLNAAKTQYVVLRSTAEQYCGLFP